MKFSVITVCYNSASTIEASLLSVLEQTHHDIEYIVVDGGSTDGTLDILNKYADKISRLISEADHGIYDALNKGLKMANGEVIGILHADDIYSDNSVIEKYNQVFSAGKCDAVYADLQYVDRTNIDKVVRTWKSGPYKHGMFLNGWMPPHPTFFVKRSCYERFGHFNTSLKTAADYELMLRMMHLHKISVNYLEAITVKMRVGGVSNLSLKNRIKANLEDRKAWKINGLHPYFYTLLLKPLRKLTQFL